MSTVRTCPFPLVIGMRSTGNAPKNEQNPLPEVPASPRRSRLTGQRVEVVRVPNNLPGLPITPSQLFA